MSSGGHDVPLMTQQFGGRRGVNWMGGLFVLIGPVQSLGAMRKVMTGGTKMTSHSDAA